MRKGAFGTKTALGKLLYCSLGETERGLGHQRFIHPKLGFFRQMVLEICK